MADEGIPAARPEAARGRSGVRVLFVGGVGRSGSTLLDLMLDQIPGFCAVGELSYLWFRTDDDLCGCGAAFASCPFWTAVGAEAFGGWERIDRTRMLDLRRRLDRHRRIPSLVLGSDSTIGTEFGEYALVMRRLFEAVRSVSGADVVVDSTKNASSAFLLRRIPGIDLRIVHLIRDSRGVAFSWMKQVRKPGIAGGDAYMDRYPPGRTSVRWVSYNLLFHVLRGMGVPTVRMRYEDLVQRPAAELGRIPRLVDRDPPTDLPFLEGGGVAVRPSHTIAGNPIRFGSGPMRLRLDDEWRRALSPAQRALVGTITWPLLLAYGYVRPATGASRRGDAR